MKQEAVKTTKAINGWLYAAAAVVLFFIIMLGNNGTYMAGKTVGLLGALSIAFMAAFASKENVKRLMTPTAFAVFAYMLLAGLSTFYAKAGKFAIAEFANLLAAFAVFAAIVLYSKGGTLSFRRTAAVLASTAAAVGVLSIDAASSNILMRPFRAIMQAVNPAYENLGEVFYSRLQTIVGNPNTYAGLMSIACLLSLWLVVTAQTRKQKILCSVLLMVNTISYVLAFSMGSLGIFVLACLLMLALSPKETRTGLFLLLLQTAVIALLAAAVSVKGFGDTATGSPLPMIMLVLGCAAACLLEAFVRGRIAAALANKGKVLVGVIAAILVAAAVYIVLALQMTGAYTFGTEGDFRRAIDLPAGEYTMTMDATAPVTVRVAYKNMGNLIQNNETDLVQGTSDAPVTFTVPEDSELTFFYFYCAEPGVTINSASYTGAQEGSVKLGYKLLPAFVADRIQDLSANGNVVQRGVYRQDAIKLWKTAPIIGRGLGGFENGVVSVQDYYYETKYAHNHYVEMLCDLGVLGLLAFLAVLGTSVWALIKSRKEKPLIVMVLAACVLQMFGQALSDVIWSVGACISMFFGVLALVTLYCGDSLCIKVSEKSNAGAVRWPIAGVSALFVVLIGLNLIAQNIFRGDNLTIDDLKTCAAIDLFEANDYKLSYLLAGADDPALADKYAKDLSRAESNAITIPLAQYYAVNGDINRALDTLEQGSDYMRADQEVWNQMFALYEAIIDPVDQFGALQLLEDDYYIQRMKQGYEKLRQVNTEQLDDVVFSVANNTFVNKLLAVAALEPYALKDALEIFSSLALDTATAADVDGDNMPDCARVKEGNIVWNDDGSFTAQTDAQVDFTVAVKNSGLYRLKVEGDNLVDGLEAYVDEAKYDIDAATGLSLSQSPQSGGSLGNTITIRVKAGMTIKRVAFEREE